ncbi:cupin domain-containing protein [Alteromonas sp. ASW11-36]|uniref:Cupin domain-containing protein n=1 Tax=Alteromonas arenosi TaxID=3055817 RepID=A0ABT7SX56_9ALTE|nr:cupin domain-containing protein [Alteromonas sp. ASW11-36]MDM7860132.1 cupin domain-containing protein [Alteromonas sp. ASW11-36]
MKIVAMIPARLGSKRVPKKNLRMLGDKPLIAYVTETARDAGVFDAVYINSEAPIFAELAEDYGVSFYQRPDQFATDASNNDEFLLDFCQNVDADIVVQILPTSPFISAEEIQAFVNAMQEQQVDTLVSTVEHQIACVYQNKGVNFSPLEPHISSQDMQPVASYATVLMGWQREKFLQNMDNLGFGYHGGDGKIGYFPLKGFSAVDIDNEEDFRLAEAVLAYLAQKGEASEPKYYQSKGNTTAHHSEADVPSILKIDGIEQADFDHENAPHVHIPDLIAAKNNTNSWCHRLVNTESNSATLISQLPGQGNRKHYHPDWNEWWYIIDGEWIWEIEGKESIVKKGDFVFMPKNKVHKITATGNGPAIRLAVSRADVAHVYPEGPQ